MVEILFKPFSISKWFGLGFCFFLANLGQGGGGNINIPSGGGGGPSTPPPSTPAPAPTPGSPGPGVGTPSGGTWPSGSGGAPSGGTSHSGTTTGTTYPGGSTTTHNTPQDPVEQMLEEWFAWATQNLWLVVGIVTAIVVFSLTLWLVLLWLRCRGTFMSIDGVALNRGSVKEPWKRYKQAGNSLFGFSVILQLIGTVLMLLSLGIAALVAWPDIAGRTFGTPALWGIIVLVVTLPLIAVNLLIVNMLLIDFIAPTMYIHDLRVRDAWRLWNKEIFKGHFWLLTLFYLMKMLLGIAVGIAAVIATCLTCCIAALPYIGTVILLPAFVFMRCYTLYFIEQFGEPWRLFVYDEGRLPCVSCGYDLQGTPDAEACPECGGITPKGLESQWA